MIAAAPPPPPPAVERPAPYAVSYGTVSGTVSGDTERVLVRVGGRVLGSVEARGRRFSLEVDLPPREVAIDVVAVGKGGARSRTRVAPVQGMPVAAAPVEKAPRHDEETQPALQELLRAYPGSAGAYALDLTTGRGAAWNALAEYPGASALKLAVATTALAAADAVPAPGSRLDGLLRRMLIVSDNMAANEVEAWIGGSTLAGSHRVNALMAGLGLTRSDMYGGYLREPSARGLASIPLRVDDQPSWGPGKRSTAFELGSLLRAVWLASGGKGPLLRTQEGFSPADARYLLYLLARVRDPGKLDRFVAGDGVASLHKAGWIDEARSDNGLLVWRGGVVLVAVMTYRASGVGTREDVLAGRLGRLMLDRVRG